MEEKLELDMEARKNYLEMMARMNKNKKSVNERRTKVKTAGQRVKIGSIKDRKMNYEKDEYFFSKEDMPEKAREARKFYAQFMESDYLGLRKKPWEHSTFIDPMNRGEVNFDVEIFRIKHAPRERAPLKPKELKVVDEHKKYGRRYHSAGWNSDTHYETPFKLQKNWEKL